MQTQSSRNSRICVMTITFLLAIVLIGGFVMYQQRKAVDTVLESQKTLLETLKNVQATGSSGEAVVSEVENDYQENMQDEFVREVPEGYKEYTEEKFSLAYPEYLQMSKPDIGYVRWNSENYIEADNGVIQSGFVITVSVSDVPVEWSNWVEWIERPRGGAGEAVEKDAQYKLRTGQVAYKKVMEGRGFMDAYEDSHSFVTIALPDAMQNSVVEIVLETRTEDLDKYEPILEDIAKSFLWEK